MNRLLTLAFLAINISGLAQAYTVGTKSITWTDPARSNRSVTLEFRYPGTNTALANGQFPFVIFGHGFQMDQVPYYPYSDSLAKQGYIVGLLTTETGLSPSHPNFAQDLIFAHSKLISESSTNSASPFYQKVIPKGALGGHSMGGGSTVLSAQYGTPATCYFTFAAATTNPSSNAVASSLNKPYLAFAGSLDCIAPPATNQLPMYDSASSPCKVYVNITNGRHCAFGNSNFQCNFGEGFSGCASSPLSTADQINKSLSFLVPFLDYYLKGDCAAWSLFESRYSSNTIDVLKRSCVNSVPSNPSIGGVTSFCNNSSTTLTAQPAGFSYTWSDNSTASTLNVSSAGNYSLVVGNGTCSLPSVSVSVSENFPPLSPSAITANDTVCSGIANINLSVTNDPTVTYNWALPQGWSITQGSGTNTLTVTSGNSGGTVSVTAENLCGVSQPSQKSITVVPSNLGNAGNITGSVSLCEGESVLYSVATVSGADNYVWTVPQGWTFNSGVNGDAVNITANANGGTISVQASNSCGQSLPSSVTVSVTALPQVTGIMSIPVMCIGETKTTFAMHNNAQPVNLIWTLPSSVQLLGGTDTITLLAVGPAGTYADTLQAQNACGISYPVVSSIVINDTPTVSITQTGSDLTATGAQGYQWYFNGQLIQGATAATYTPTQTGSYTAVGTSADGCTGTSGAYSFVYSGVSEPTVDVFHIAPNPAMDVAVISLLKASNGLLRLLGVDGRLLLEKQIQNNNETISLSNFAKGVYVVSVDVNGKNYRQRLVVQ